MRSTKKNQQSGGQAEIIAAVKALASEKDISEEMLYNAIEEALKAAYKKNVSREENAPTNLSVTLDRTTGVAQVFARKTITDEVEDPANQISLEDALKIRSDYRMGDIARNRRDPHGLSAHRGTDGQAGDHAAHPRGGAGQDLRRIFRKGK